MRQYSIDRVEFTWAGLDFKEGMAQGATITEARTTMSFSMKATGMGKVVRVYNPDRSGTLSMVVDQESRLHQQLRAVFQADQLSRNQVFPATLTDTSTGEVFNYSNAFLQSEPDETRGTESATFTWVLMFESISKLNGPAEQNAVGS